MTCAKRLKSKLEKLVEMYNVIHTLLFLICLDLDRKNNKKKKDPEEIKQGYNLSFYFPGCSVQMILQPRSLYNHIHCIIKALHLGFNQQKHQCFGFQVHILLLHLRASLPCQGFSIQQTSILSMVFSAFMNVVP